ncbi:MAG: FxLYD domain-containing protein, partial [Aggregatilineales bacterium]
VVNGMVTNGAGAPLEAVRLTALLYDANDAVRAEQANALSADVLLPNASAPFAIRFRGGKPARAVRYEVRGVARHAEFTLQSYLGEEAFLRGNEIARYNANGFLTVSGDIVNQTQEAATLVKIIIAVLDDQGRVVATDSTFLNRPLLLPGEAARFEVVFPELGGGVIRYLISVEGKRP